MTWFDKAWTGPIEVKAQHVRARFDRRARVLQIRDATDFYKSHSRTVEFSLAQAFTPGVTKMELISSSLLQEAFLPMPSGQSFSSHSYLSKVQTWFPADDVPPDDHSSSVECLLKEARINFSISLQACAWAKRNFPLRFPRREPLR